MRKWDVRVVHTVPALFAGTDGGVLGGAERYAYELARHMANAVPTTLVSFGDQDLKTSDANLQVRIFGNPVHVRGLPSNPFSFNAVSFLRHFDVIHCHQRHIFISSAAAALARVTGKSVFVSDLGGGGWDISRYVSTENWYHGHLHISEYSRTVSKQKDSPRAHVILGGVDTERFSPNASTPKNGHVLFVGRILPHKGVNDLVDALPSGIALDIAGQAYHPEFFRELRRRGEGKDIRFHHGFTDSDLVQAYRSSLCIVLPSVYRTLYGDQTLIPELLGQTLLEGMACGTPAICTDVASMPEIVEDGVTGFVVPPNNPAALHDKIVWLRDHPEEAQRMGEAARRRMLDLFTWPVVVDRCLKIYAAH